MTDRINALTVVLDKNLREDDVQDLANAIKCFQGVLTVETHVANVDSYVAESRAKAELVRGLQGVIDGMLSKSTSPR